MNVFRVEQVIVDNQLVQCGEGLDYIFVPIAEGESFRDAIEMYMLAERGQAEANYITFSRSVYVGKMV